MNDGEDNGDGEDVDDDGASQSGHSYKWLQFLPHPCEDSNFVHVHYKEAIYLVSDHYEPVSRIYRI